MSVTEVFILVIQCNLYTYIEKRKKKGIQNAHEFLIFKLHLFQTDWLAYIIIDSANLFLFFFFQIPYDSNLCLFSLFLSNVVACP